MKFLLVFLICLSAAAMYAQDTIVLLSGEKIPVQSYTVNDKENIISFVNKRGKDKYIELDYIFCIKKTSGEEQLIYSDSAFEDDSITVAEMREFVNGAITANETYHAPLAAISGFVVGAGSVYLFPQLGVPVFYSPVIPGAYTMIYGSITPKEKCILKKCPEAAGRPYFIKGYSEMCQQKRVNSVVKGSVAGIAAMVITAIIINR